MLKPNALFSCVVGFASVGEKHTDQMLIAIPLRNANHNCAGICRRKTRDAKHRGTAMIYTTNMVRSPRRFARRLLGTVPARVPIVKAAVMYPMARSVK